MNKLNYSVALLVESNILERGVDLGDKVYEESIVLVNIDEDFFTSNSEEYILEYFRANIPDFSYKNEYGETVENKIVRVIEYFEIFKEIKFTDFTEVFSRYIIADKDNSIDDILERYFGL